MRMYRPVYRCRLCGATITSEYSEITPDDAIKFTSRVLQTALYAENPYLGGDKSKGIHQCDDGSVGVADYCGMEQKA